MLDTQTFCWKQGRPRVWVSRSEMNDEVDPLSSNALASTDDPSAAKTSTLQVMKRELDLSFTAVLETT